MLLIFYLLAIIILPFFRTYDNITGIETLKVQTISQAQAFQRAGRAGRESDGFVYRAYTVQVSFAFHSF